MSGAVRRIVLPGDPLRDGPTSLRPWRDSDIEALVPLCADPEIVRWIRVPSPYGRSDARAYVGSRLDAAHTGASADFAITESSSGALLGAISLLRLTWRHRRGEVGYWLGAPARGQGHATRAVAVICAWGVRALGLERIELLAATDNLASRAVARRAGFTEEAILRSYLPGADGRQAMVCYGWLAGERLR